MRIVFVVETYSDGVGYIENCLPPALAKLGQSAVVSRGSGSLVELALAPPCALDLESAD